MDRFANKQFEKQTIYEIFRACRLCGAGGGFKMPIIQNVVDLDDTDVELKQKIRDCVQIEVHPDDKMPPLICELCIDKINDFYEFLEMCRQTNTRTRKRLGLPLQKSAGVTEEGDCILGMSEGLTAPDSEDEPLSRQPQKKPQKTAKGQKVPPVVLKKCNIKIESMSSVKNSHIITDKQVKEMRSQSKKRETTPPRGRNRNREPTPETTPPRGRNRNREPTPEITPPRGRNRNREPTPEIMPPRGRNRNREPTPPPKRITRQQEGEKIKGSKTENSSRLSTEQKTTPKSISSTEQKTAPKSISSAEQKTAPKSILKPPKKESPAPKLIIKMTEPQEPPVRELPKRKRSIEPVSTKSAPIKKVKIASPSPKPRPPSPPKTFTCNICSSVFNQKSSLSNHLKSHYPTFTPQNLACNACGEWFATAEATGSHHGKHRNNPYRCRNCFNTFPKYIQYNQHFEKDPCVLFEEVPDYKCDECWVEFVTQYMYLQHRCPGIDGRKGGECKKCNKSYSLQKNLLKHEATCTYRKKGSVYIEPEVERSLRVAEVRIGRCDSLLKTTPNGRYDVSRVRDAYGLDPTKIYPYRRVKRELNDSMVKIHHDPFDYVHWDSDYGSDSDRSQDGRKVHSLGTLALKVIFSKRCLGRLPKRRRGIKCEDAFDSMINSDGDKKINRDIASIIANLDKAWDDDEDFDKKDDDAGSVSLLDMGDGNESADVAGKKGDDDAGSVSLLDMGDGTASADVPVTSFNMVEDGFSDEGVNDSNKGVDVSGSEVSSNDKERVGESNEASTEEVKKDVSNVDSFESQTYTQNDTIESQTFTQNDDEDMEKNDVADNVTENNEVVTRIEEERLNQDDSAVTNGVCKDVMKSDEEFHTKPQEFDSTDDSNKHIDTNSLGDHMKNGCHENSDIKNDKRENEMETYDKDLMDALDERIDAYSNDRGNKDVLNENNS